MRILACVGRFAYGRPERGPGVEISTMIPAFARLGHDVEIFDSTIRNKYRDYADLNRALVEVALCFKPELIFTVVSDVELWEETILYLRAMLPDTAVVSWATDDTWKYRKVSRFVGRFHHGMITTYADTVAAYRSDGVDQVLVSQWAANEEWIRPPLVTADCLHQVSFVGIAYGDRHRVVQALAQRGVRVECFGYQWPSGPIAAEQIPNIMQRSVISLNFSKGMYGGPNQVKARTFEVPGAGGFLLTEAAPGLERWFVPRQEIAVWNDIDDLESQIRYYLSHPGERDDMARKAHERTLREHRYELRMRDLLAWASGLPKDRVARVDFNAAVARHRAGRWIRSGGEATERLMRPLLGAHRSQRLLRRIGFEATWRLAGARTFSSAGWFGRAFPPMD